jgi:hypothetical protein
MDSVYIRTVAVLSRYKHLVYIYLSWRTLFTTLYTEQPHRHGLVLSGVIKVNLSTPFTPHKLGRLWCQLLMFACLQNGRYAIISHSNITITIFLHSSYTQIPRIINVTMIYLHPHKPGRLWCQPLMFACLQNGLYAIISHSTITIIIFLHF